MLAPIVSFSVTATWLVASGVSSPGTAGVSGPISRPASMMAARSPTTWTRSLSVSSRPGEGVSSLLPRLTPSTVIRPPSALWRSPTVRPSASVTR
ncbi:hypothetical protein SCALM49S_05291 [Streptomyces californicus]